LPRGEALGITVIIGFDGYFQTVDDSIDAYRRHHG
jgi:hypothetical protein